MFKILEKKLNFDKVYIVDVLLCLAKFGMHVFPINTFHIEEFV